MKEVDSLEGTGRGDKGYDSTGISGSQSNQFKISRPSQDSNSDQAVKTPITNYSDQRQSQLSQTRQIISARQIQKLTKDDNPVFLSIIRSTNEAPRTRGKKGNKRSPVHVARFAAHGLTESQKRLMTEKLALKRILLLSKKENNRFSTMSLKSSGKIWKHSSRSTMISFLKSCQKGSLPRGGLSIKSRLNPAVNLPIGHHTDWVLLSRMS